MDLQGLRLRLLITPVAVFGGWMVWDWIPRRMAVGAAGSGECERRDGAALRAPLLSSAEGDTIAEVGAPSRRRALSK